MIFQLRNSRLHVAVESLGAELRSVCDRAGTEYMWQCNPGIWPRTAPVLFPVIGRLRDGAYTMGGQSYAMPRHGFARDLPFEVTAQTGASIDLCVASDARTRACYPFDFLLEIRYELDGACLRKTHTVHNRSSETIWFELGGHDGFRVALDRGETMADYFLLFEGETVLRPRLKREDGLFSEARGALPLDAGRLWLDMALFRSDAIVLDRLPVRKVLLCNSSGSRRLTFAFPDFSILGIWTPHMPFDTNFICLEAWSSLPDSAAAGPELASKEGICQLEPGGLARFCYTTEFPVPVEHKRGGGSL